MSDKKWDEIWREIYSDWEIIYRRYFGNALILDDPIFHLTKVVKNDPKLNWQYEKDYGWLSMESIKNEKYRNCGKYSDSEGLRTTVGLLEYALYKQSDDISAAISDEVLFEKVDNPDEKLAAVYLGAVVHSIVGGRNEMSDHWRGEGFRILQNIQISIKVVHEIDWHHASTSTMPIDIDTDLLTSPRSYRDFIKMTIHNVLVNLSCYRPVIIHPIYKIKDEE